MTSAASDSIDAQAHDGRDPQQTDNQHDRVQPTNAQHRLSFIDVKKNAPNQLASSGQKASPGRRSEDPGDTGGAASKN